MKKVSLFLLSAFVVTLAFGQDKTKARVEIIKPKADMVGEFEKGLAAHIQKFHPKATDAVTIYLVSSGNHSGEYHFVQGPMSWADMEGKQYSGEHSDDWTKNVAKYTLSTETHYYTFQPDYSYNVSEADVEWSTVAFISLNGSTASTYQKMMKTRVEVLGKAKDSRSYAIYSHSFSGRDGEHNYVSVTPLKGGLKDLDTPTTPIYKVLSDILGPNAAIDDSKDGDRILNKVDVMLVRRMAGLSSK